MGTYSGGAGTELSPYQIGTQADLVELFGTSTDWDKYFIQTADIDLTSQSSWTPIGNSSTKFTGQYDGDTKTISNLAFISSGDFYGFFGYIGGATMKNIVVDDFQLSVGASSSSGAFIGVAETGTITNCAILNSTVTVSHTSNKDYVGVFIGNHTGTAITKSFAKDCVLDLDSVGAGSTKFGIFCGARNGGTFADCFSTGTITRDESTSEYIGGFSGSSYSTADRCFSIATFDGSEAVSTGGFSGKTGGTDSDCFFDSTVAGFTDTSTGVPKTTTEMKTQSTFTNYDFDDVWVMGDSGYPELQWYSSGGGGGIKSSITTRVYNSLGIGM